MNQNCVVFDSYNWLIAECLINLLMILSDKIWLLWVKEESDISTWEAVSSYDHIQKANHFKHVLYNVLFSLKVLLWDLTIWLNYNLTEGTGWYMCFKHRGCISEGVSSLSVQSRGHWRRRSFEFYNYMIRLSLYNLLNLIESRHSYS